MQDMVKSSALNRAHEYEQLIQVGTLIGEPIEVQKIKDFIWKLRFFWLAAAFILSYVFGVKS